MWIFVTDTQVQHWTAQSANSTITWSKFSLKPGLSNNFLLLTSFSWNFLFGYRMANYDKFTSNIWSDRLFTVSSISIILYLCHLAASEVKKWLIVCGRLALFFLFRHRCHRFARLSLTISAQYRFIWSRIKATSLDSVTFCLVIFTHPPS